VSLNWGVDDIDGTVVRYEITRRPGAAGRHQELSVDDLKRLIIEAGGNPCRTGHALSTGHPRGDKLAGRD